jgi:hypothetical protein
LFVLLGRVHFCQVGFFVSFFFINRKFSSNFLPQIFIPTKNVVSKSDI